MQNDLWNKSPWYAPQDVFKVDYHAKIKSIPKILFD